jgi:hypothetical protein
VVAQTTSRPASNNQPYWLDPGFERAVVTLACCRPRFYGRIGHALDPSCLTLPEAKLALEAALAVGKALGRGPESCLIVLQRIRRWMDEGRSTLEEAQAVSDMFDAAEDAGLPTEEAAVQELAPLLRKRIQGDAVRAAMDDYAKGDADFERTTKLIHRAKTLGDTDTSVGIRLGSASFAELERVRGLEKRPLGILELDQALAGGQRRGTLAMFVGGPGAGKSMAMSHGASNDVKHGLFAVYATLEVTVPDVIARVKANLTGVPINAILEEPRCVERLLTAMPLGPFVVQEFTPLVTTMDDIAAWVEEVEQQEGRRVDVLYIDYGDKVGVPRALSGRDESGYKTGQIVFEAMRVYANEGHPGGKIWVVTGAQATRAKDKRKRVGLDDIADSMHKARVADLVVTINAEDDQLSWHVAKNRHGKTGLTVGPLPHDFDCGRSAPVMEAELDDELVKATQAALRLGGVRAATNLVLGRAMGEDDEEDA